jgi:hypothetical protein
LGFFSMEETMRRYILAVAAAAAVLAAGVLTSGRAEAMTLSAPAGMQGAINDTNLAQDVAYGCRRSWRCGPYGCGWRRVCRWTGGRYYGRPYGYWRGGRYYRRW